MKRLIAIICLHAAACASTTVPAPPAATASDLRWIDTLREVDELSDSAIGSANFQTERKDLSEWADKAAHAHSERSREIKAWRDSYFPNAPKDIVLPACGQHDFRPPADATASQIIQRLITHRECGLSLAREAISSVRSEEARRLAEKTAAAYQAELTTLRVWD